MKNTEQLALHIVRHGKSSWDYGGCHDLDRPLTEKGIESVHLMAQRFFGKQALPELVISSPANRALHTATIFIRQFHIPFTSFRIDEKIYSSDVSGIMTLIAETEPRVKNLMLVGHNPVFTDLANTFLRKKIDNLPTAGLISLYFQASDWSEVTPGRLASENFDYPKKMS